jgi:hypothetical protein
MTSARRFSCFTGGCVANCPYKGKTKSRNRIARLIFFAIELLKNTSKVKHLLLIYKHEEQPFDQ